MDKLFQIGDFIFRLCCPAEVTPPENFMKFEIGWGLPGEREPGLSEEDGVLKVPEYTYHIEVSDYLPEPDGKIVARRPDLLVFQRQAEGDGQLLESRLIGVKGRPDPYACYRETSANRGEILLMQDELRDLHIDPLFTSLLALERRLVRKDQMVLHCAYVEYRGEAILFSAPSDGKDHPGRALGEVPGQQGCERGSVPVGKKGRQVDRPGMAGMRDIRGMS